MMTTLILVFILAAVARGDITGSEPRNGACLCINGNSVNIRSSACGQRVIGSASSGQCFRYAGSNNFCNLNGRNYHFFRINYNGNGWTAGVFLNLASDDRCNSPGASLPTNSGEYKCQVSDQGRRIHELKSPTKFDCVDLNCKNTCRGGQCVAYVKCRCTRNGRYPPSTGAWRPGQKLKAANGKCNRNVAPNTAIATFPSNGEYYGHAAVFIRCSADGNSVEVYDQYCGKSVGYTTYSLSHARYGTFATITSSNDSIDPMCRSEASGSSDCQASVSRCQK